MSQFHSSSNYAIGYLARLVIPNLDVTVNPRLPAACHRNPISRHIFWIRLIPCCPTISPGGSFSSLEVLGRNHHRAPVGVRVPTFSYKPRVLMRTEPSGSIRPARYVRRASRSTVLRFARKISNLSLPAPPKGSSSYQSGGILDEPISKISCRWVPGKTV